MLMFLDQKQKSSTTLNSHRVIITESKNNGECYHWGHLILCSSQFSLLDSGLRLYVNTIWYGLLKFWNYYQITTNPLLWWVTFPSNSSALVLRMWAVFLPYVSPSYTKDAHQVPWSSHLHLLSFSKFSLCYNVQIPFHSSHPSPKWPPTSPFPF